MDLLSTCDRVRPLAIAALIALAIAGCATERQGSTLTEHQRDSVLATSALRGARVTAAALAATSREAARAADMDTLGR
jgi:hypothetical protein